MPGLRVARPEERAEPASDIRVELAASLEEFADLAPAWNELHEHAAAASIFNSWMWLYEWWRGYGAGRELCILVARHEGAIVGVLPLCRERTRVAGMRVVLARFIGTGGDT